MTFNEKIAEHIHELNETDKKVMNYIIKHYETLPNKKISEISEALYISPNAIVRLAKKIGYSGFSELKFSIAHEKSPAAETNYQLNYFSMGEKMIKNMQKTIDMNREKNFYQAARTIAAANKIVFIALGVTKNTAQAFIQRLEVLNKVCVLSSYRDNALTLAKNLDDSFLAFFVSLSGDSEIIIQCANYFKEKNVKIISLTGLSQNYLQEVSDISLYAYSETKEIDYMDVSSRSYLDFMLDLLYMEVLKQQN